MRFALITQSAFGSDGFVTAFREPDLGQTVIAANVLEVLMRMDVAFHDTKPNAPVEKVP